MSGPVEITPNQAPMIAEIIKTSKLVAIAGRENAVDVARSITSSSGPGHLFMLLIDLGADLDKLDDEWVDASRELAETLGDALGARKEGK